MIKLEKVNKYFNKRRRNEIHIINNTSLELEDKGLVAILGQSGSGKTTLLNAIGGLDKVNRGKIYINGKKITRRRQNTVDKIRNLNIGYIFQDYKLIENMSVFENVAISLRMIGLKNKNEIKKRVNYVLEAVNMYRYRNRPASMLSGGEKQRVAIARAIVKNPSIVIADEPTGNLDSKNSLEIMNIIKAISKEKLVILVTHEVDLANFYATRIIEVQDGKVVKDYANETKESLEYRLDNKIYLKDLEEIKEPKNDKINMNIYSDGKDTENIEIKLVIKDGNIFIQAENRKIEVVDDNSAIELIDEHYKKIDKSIYEKYKYNLDDIVDKKYKTRYSSIYGIFKSIKNGSNRIFNYTVLKKILLLGFFASAMFVLYSVSNIAGITNIKESDYIEIDRNYLQVDMASIRVDDYLKYENLENVDYILPGEGKVSFKIKMNEYYQLSRYSFELAGTLVSIDKINQADLTSGKMPENEYEIVIDKKIIDNMNKSGFMSFSAMGVQSAEELIGKIVNINDMKDFKIVGVTDKNTDSIYANKNVFTNIFNNMKQSDLSMGIYLDRDEDSSDITVKDYNLYMDDITITKGRLPENDYEVIVNKNNQDEMKLNKPIKTEVNGVQLTVVGYYDSKTNRQDYLVNNNTVKYSVITKSNGFMIYPKNKYNVMSQFQNEYHLNIIDRYEKDKQTYINSKKDEIKSAVIFAGVILAISLIEIYLMIRSSFLSRIKEIGVLRAIGVKKKDIYRMFVGEIISITTIASMPGIALMTYILNQVSKIPYVDRMFIINFNTVGISVLLVYLFNIIVGLLPLVKVLRKTPAKILARHDVE